MKSVQNLSMLWTSSDKLYLISLHCEIARELRLSFFYGLWTQSLVAVSTVSILGHSKQNDLFKEEIL